MYRTLLGYYSTCVQSSSFSFSPRPFNLIKWGWWAPQQEATDCTSTWLPLASVVGTGRNLSPLIASLRERRVAFRCACQEVAQITHGQTLCRSQRNRGGGGLFESVTEESIPSIILRMKKKKKKSSNPEYVSDWRFWHHPSDPTMAGHTFNTFDHPVTWRN